jgi:F420-dependent oxidoreductase-like protein
MAGLQICWMVEGQEDVTWSQWRELAAVTEAYGFQGLFRSDHYLSEDPSSGRGSLETWGTICALASITSRIRLGTLVSPASIRHPSVLAKLAVTADHISDGRVELGIGAGWYEAEHVAYGFPFEPIGERLDILEEQLEIITHSWEPDAFSHDGSHYRVTDLDARPKPLQARLPIILGGRGGRRSLGLAARWADEYNTPLCSEDEFRERIGALHRACEATGRDPGTVRVSTLATVLVGRDRSELERRAIKAAALASDHSDPSIYLQGCDPSLVTGTTDEVIAKLRDLHSIGVDRVVLETIDHRDLDMINLIGDEILPVVTRG